MDVLSFKVHWCTSCVYQCFLVIVSLVNILNVIFFLLISLSGVFEVDHLMLFFIILCVFDQSKIWLSVLCSIWHNHASYIHEIWWVCRWICVNPSKKKFAFFSMLHFSFTIFALHTWFWVCACKVFWTKNRKIEVVERERGRTAEYSAENERQKTVTTR